MSTKPQSYRDLIVWQKSIELAKRLYELSARFPVEEKFGLTAQLRRAAVSVSSNIAEGQARNTTGEFLQFLSHAQGSAAEADTQLYLALELGFVAEQDVRDLFALIDEIRRMLNGLRRRLNGDK